MFSQIVTADVGVHCRIGSLESTDALYPPRHRVHCRIGSLEMRPLLAVLEFLVHCRIGSLEITKSTLYINE